MAAPKPVCIEQRKWLLLRGWSLAPLTGQDYRAIAAYIHCLDLYAASDAQGRGAALESMRALLCAMQEKIWPIACELIIGALDTTNVVEIWHKIAPTRALGIATDTLGRRSRPPGHA